MIMIIQGNHRKTVVGAGAVVKDLPANCTAVGSPANQSSIMNRLV